MDRPLVSTITPCYRMDRYLRLFLQQLPQQTFFKSLEVVLDHNDPTDEELHWVRDFQEKYPGRLKHHIVRPVDPIGVSMNRCIQMASADLVTIWNVDDLRTPDSIEAQAKVLLSDPQADIVYGNFLEVATFGATTGRMVHVEAIPEAELTRSMIVGPFFMFRKDLCKKAGYFDEQLRSAADFDLALRLALHGRAKRVPVPLGYYLNEGLGASTRPGDLPQVEQTVICLRYGIYDKVNYAFAAQAARYNVMNILSKDSWLSVAAFVPNYKSFLEGRYKMWHATGLKAFVRRFLSQKGLLQRSARAVKRSAAKILARSGKGRI